jgi:acid phosphatase
MRFRTKGRRLRAVGVGAAGVVMVAGLAAIPVTSAAPSESKVLRAQIASGGETRFLGTPASDPAAGLRGPSSRSRAARLSSAADLAARIPTDSPIKHVVVIIGENHTFDNVYGTYKPAAGQTVKNLLSEGIVTENGQLGPNAGLAKQNEAKNRARYKITPEVSGSYSTLPQPNTTYAMHQPLDVPDPRFPANLPNGPFQITKYVPYQNAFVGDPLHRFYQMAQEIGRNNNHLWTWVHQTAGDDNGATPPAPIYQGALDMGYYNMAKGDAPALKFLSDHYATSDNYHQAVQGGTGANHVAIGTGYAASYQDASGNPLTPPSNEIENPNPKPGTNNNYTQDGYSGGTYSNCSDPTQAGVGPILDYLSSLGRSGNCQPNTYYMLNNYSPGYNADGTINHSAFAVSPQTLPTVGDALNAKDVSWKYYGQGWNGGKPRDSYCDICNPFQYVGSIMTSPTQRAEHIQDVPQFEQDAAAGNLPAVSFLKPDSIYDGHPASSALSLFEQFARNAIKNIQANRELWKSTAIIVTMDEGGGYYDSGYVQPVDFFGDGTRIPTLVISPYTRPGKIDHTYTDHVSILKFIERNWFLKPLSGHSRDNLPDPVAASSNPYVPTNGPAIGDLFTMFDFKHPQKHPALLP